MEQTIKTFDDACAALGLNPFEEIPFAEPKNDNQKAVNAAAKLFIIANALNGDWKPNWYNWDEYKYFPWFDLSPEKQDDDEGPAGGSGFSYYGYFCVYSYSGVGSRLVFKTRDLAEYAGKQFLDIYRDLMIIE